MSIEALVKRVARSTVQPLIPPRTYAQVVKLFYRVFGSLQNSDWHVFEQDPRLDPVLKEMMLAHEKVAPSEQSSEYWRVLNAKNIRQLVEDGFGNFKQTVALNYFTFLESTPQQEVLKQNLSAETQSWARAQVVDAPVHALFGAERSRAFNFMTFLLFRFLKQQVGDELLAGLAEPLVGNPPAVLIDGRPVTQDLANSTLEFDSVRSGILERGGQELWDSIERVLELGAGYGRTGYAFLKLKPGVKYVIADIPPALYVSQRYLSEVFPDKKVFRFREFSDFETVRAEFERADIAFVMPEQLRLLPQNAIDLFMAIDCLHEMTPPQIDSYFSTADRLARFFYFTCRKTIAVAYDGIILEEKDYPVRSHWRRLFQRSRRVQQDYFEAEFELHPV